MKDSALNEAWGISINPDVINAVERKDTDKILTVMKTVTQNSDIEFITITDEKGIVLARTHEPSKKGDSVLSQTNVRQALSGKVNSQVGKGL